MKFNIGDRVQTKLNRTPGTVRWARDGMVVVETDDPNEGVPLPGFEVPRGLFLSADAWEKISPSKIVITSDGKTTLARLYDGNRVIRRAEAKCSPEDTYDFAAGANLAYDRLMQPSKPTKPANKYDAMSNDELVDTVCDMGMCSASRSNIRHADCPFKNTPAYNSGTGCHGFLHAHPELRPVLVQYLVDEDAAKEPKPEPKQEPAPVKLYCVKSDTPGEWVTKGKIYEAAERGSIIFDNGWKSNYDFREGVPEEWKNNLVPLVSRPAKAGEWVLVNHISGDSGGISVGDIALVVMVNNGCGPYIRSKEKTIFGYNELGNVTLLKDDWCEVLDGYDGRYEQTEPKYLSGKVVCVETHDDFTVGKVYTFKDGKVTDDSWNRRPMNSYSAESLEDWNRRCGDCIVRFIEYKGEA